MRQFIKRLKSICLVVCILQLAPVASWAEEKAPFEALMAKAPEGANVLVTFNVQQILRSTYALSHNSQAKLAESFAQRGILIPPDATQFVMAAQFDFDRLQQNWAAAIIGLKSPLNFDRAATLVRGTVESISGLQGIGLPKVFALNLGENQLGLLAPCNRQQAARWAQQIKRDRQPLSPYLAHTGTYGDTAGTDIILAIDLAEAVPPQFVADRIAYLLRNEKVDAKQVAAIISRVQGARLGIKIGTKCNGMLVIDLQDDPAMMADVAKPLLLQTLGNCGCMLDEMKDWKLTLGKTSIALSGNLDDESMQRVMSVVELPADPLRMNALPTGSGNDGEVSSEAAKRDASRQYFREVQHRLDSLRMQKSEAKSMGQVAMWIDNVARGIDRMSILNVDPELLDYGAKVSAELRQAVGALQGAGIQTGAQAAQVYGSDSYYYDTDVQGARRAIKAEEHAEGATSALDLSRVIANQSASIRRKMSEKYQVDF